MARRSTLRASDADRERVAERLRQAAAEGRILADELEERLARALRATTYGDLDAVVEDLPGSATHGMVRSRSRRLELARRHPFVAAALLVVVAMSVATVAMAAIAAAASLVWVLAIFAFFGMRVRGFRRRQQRDFDNQRIYAHVRRYGRF